MTELELPSYRSQMDAAERRAIETALTLTHGRRDRAARLLQLSVRTLHLKLRKLQVPKLRRGR